MKELEIRLNCLADKVPSEREEIGNGQIDINLNIRNVTITDHDGKTRSAVSFDSYRVKSTSASEDDIINALIRSKYGVSEEFAILRQRDTKAEEFASYNSFCESCKALGKTIFAKLTDTEKAIATEEEYKAYLKSQEEKAMKMKMMSE